MQSCLSLCDIDDDDTVTASLRVDMESLEAEMRQLEKAWKDSILTSAAAHSCHCQANCASDNVTASDSHCRHLCDKTTCVDEHTLVNSDVSLCKQPDSDTCDIVDHRTVETNTSLCTCHQSANHRGVETDTTQSADLDCRADTSDRHVTKCSVDDGDRHGVKCDVDLFGEFVMSSSDTLCLSRYKSCCSKLQRLFDRVQFVTHRRSQQQQAE